MCDSTKIEEFFTVRKQLPTIDRLFAVSLRERLRNHKVFTKKHSVFTLIIISSPQKSYVLDVYYNRLISTTYDFMEKYRNFSLFIILIPTPDIPHFHYMLGGNQGSLLYGDVSVMFVQT